MKKLVLALTAMAAFTAPALAADMAAPLRQGSGSGCSGLQLDRLLDFGGGGGGIWQPTSTFESRGAGIPLTIDQRRAARAGSATVGIGYDWQFSGQLGGRRVSRDGQFGSIKGTSAGSGSTAATGTSKVGGLLGGWRSRRLLGGPERSVLRQRRLLRAHFGRDRSSDTISRPSRRPASHRRLQPQRLVRRRRRREQPDIFGILRRAGS